MIPLKKNRLFVLGILVSALFYFVPASRADTPTFQSFAQRDGLASDYVTSVAFAPDGAAWLGTSRGATRVQTKYWVSYTAANGLPNADVRALAIASDGKIYFATNGGGLTLFDGTKRKTYDTTSSAIPSNYLTAVALDKSGRVWVGTFGAGVARLDGDTWTKYALANNYINALALDASGNPWVATNDGAFFFDGKSWTRFTQAAGLASNQVNTVALAPDGKIWFGTENGATVYDGKTYHTYKKSDGLADNNVRAIAFETANRAWLGTAHGVTLFDAGKWKTDSVANGLADDTVTTLALDAQKNLWVGTPHGVSVTGAPLQRTTTYPVVLVHGWHTADSDQIDDTEFRFIKHDLEQDGFQVFYAAGISPFNTLFENAQVLRDVIAEVLNKTGAPRVDVIAFSMGGLNTRAYLESSLYQNNVRRAIILGTPQAGVQLWYPLLTREIEDRPTEPSAIELSPEYATLFNRTHAPRVTVPYDLLVGDARTQTGLGLLQVFPPSDGLIDVWSAHALSGPQVRHITDSDVHAWDPAPLPVNPTSYLYPAQTYERFIRNALRDPDARPIGFAAAPVEPLAPRNTTPLNVDTLRAGDTITRVLPIDLNRAARFIARWNTGDVTVTLRAPNGTRYTPNTVRDSTSTTFIRQNGAGLLDATYLKADMGSLIGYAIPHAQPGSWQLIATRADTGNQALTLTTYVDLDADLKFDLKVDPTWYPPGAPIVVETQISNKDANADVRVKIEWLGDGVTPRGDATEVKLLEEGDPGTYADTLTGLTRGGYYLLRVTARGNDYARERETLIAVSPKTATFDGAARAYRQDGTLTIDANANVARAGNYALAATLRDARGQLVTAITAPQTFRAGKQTATVAIPGRDIRARGLDGPYTIELVLMDANWAAVQTDQTQTLTTEPYRANDFGE